jgi:hypothetical protein
MAYSLGLFMELAASSSFWRIKVKSLENVEMPQLGNILL